MTTVTTGWRIYDIRERYCAAVAEKEDYDVLLVSWRSEFCANEAESLCKGQTIVVCWA